MGRTIPTRPSVAAAFAGAVLTGLPLACAMEASARTRIATMPPRLSTRKPVTATGPRLSARSRVTARAAGLSARSSRVLKATDTAHLHYISASGSLLYEVGKATGTLPGSMQVHLLVAATFSGSFTFHVRGGSINGHGRAIPKGSGVYESFVGSLIVTGGSGRFSHAHGTAHLYGTFNRDTYALVMQTVGILHY